MLFLSPYSLDLNPIEQLFASPRPCAEKRVNDPSKRLGKLLDGFPPAQCANYLRNSGRAAN